MSRIGWALGACLLGLVARAAAQPLTLDCTPLQVNSGFAVALTGPAGSPLHLALDVTPGPIQTVEVGPVSLGFTPLLTILPLMVFDGAGQAGFLSGVNDRPDWVGNVIYAQAVGLAPGSPTGFGASNPIARAIHHETRSGSTPVVLALADNDATWVDVPFGVFPFFGATHTRVGVSSNGLLSFGTLNIDPSEHEADFRAGTPKVAVLWDDLVPGAGGQVDWEAGTDWLRISWRQLPQPWVADASTAHVTLHADGALGLHWEAVSAPDALIGVSPGAWTGAPLPVDFSAAPGGESGGPRPIYELFPGGSAAFDLAGLRLTFLPLGDGFRWVH